MPKTDAEILDWLESYHSLHYSVEFIYVVDGYVTQLLRDSNTLATFHGKTLRDSIVLAMSHPVPNDHPINRLGD